MEEVGRASCQQDVAHELPLADFRDDAEGLRDAAKPALLLEKSLGEGVIGEDESLAGRQVVLLLDPVQYLARRFFRERQEEDLFSWYAFLPKPPVALDEHPRLSGTRAGHDQQRTSGMGDRGPLRVGEGCGCRDHPENCRKRISRTARVPIRSLSRSINMLRSRCS